MRLVFSFRAVVEKSKTQFSTEMGLKTWKISNDFFSRVSVSSRVSRATKSFSTLWSIFKSWATRGSPSSTRFGESACPVKKDPLDPCSWRFMNFRTRGPPCFSITTSSSRSTKTLSVRCQFSIFFCVVQALKSSEFLLNFDVFDFCWWYHFAFLTNFWN